MATKVAGADTNDPRIKVTLSPAQIAIVWPGLDFILRSYQSLEQSGRSHASYPFRMYGTLSVTLTGHGLMRSGLALECSRN